MNSTTDYETFDSASIPDVLPVLPLQESVVFPYIIVPLSIGPDASIHAVEEALGNERVVLLCKQKHDVEHPAPDDLESIGTAALVMRMLKLPDGRVRVLVQGLARARAVHFGRTTPFLQARCEVVEDHKDEQGEDIEALLRSAKSNLERAVSLGKEISSDVMVIATNLEEAGRLADLIASNLEIKHEEAQKILEERNVFERLRRANSLLVQELSLLDLEQEINEQAREEIERGQREFFLRQQMKSIQEALGDADDLTEEIEEYRTRARERELSEEAAKELERQIRRLERTHPDSAESSVIRTYLDWLTGLPWGLTTEDDLDLERARRILDRDHFDLTEIKDRIIEFLAVRKLRRDAKGPILCMVGPPGVGKTSLGRSVARALGRKFVRLSLGGVRDEAEVRGHRRTYVGAMPGRILQGLHSVGTSNPVFMLDEIDKVGSDMRGDPSSALLEVLDPEQNTTFRDHYLGVDYDLSKVLFLTTANLLDPIQPAFLDRMEILRIPGYTRNEKIQIAKRHLIPKQIEENGLEKSQVRFTAAGLSRVLDDYTRESGVRGLERRLGSLCRKVAVGIATAGDSEVKTRSIGPKQVRTWLGPPKHHRDHLLELDRVGIATGLAWTATGGDILMVEVSAVPGKGRLVLTGRLGDVMRESAQAALTFVRGASTQFTDTPDRADFFAKHDIHVHVPAGSIPKDGPSAGVTIVTALVSLLRGVAVRRDVAMTGEITLRGDILPIGGLREKLLAAQLSGVRTVLIPKANEAELEVAAKDLEKGLDVHAVGHVDELLRRALADG